MNQTKGCGPLRGAAAGWDGGAVDGLGVETGGCGGGVVGTAGSTTVAAATGAPAINVSSKGALSAA